MNKRATKYISFSIDGTYYAMPVNAVGPFIKGDNSLLVPKANEIIKGLIYQNGKIITIIDSAKLLALPKQDKFATCLTEKEVTMYGAYWCPHCADQKELFGSAFKNVNYVECTEEIKTCLEKKVDGYPTWIFKNGERLVGKYPLETLAEKSGCDIKATLYGKNK